MKLKPFLFLLLIYLFFACTTETAENNKDYSSHKESSESINSDTLDFNYLLNLVTNNEEVTEELCLRFFSDSLNMMLQNQKETNGFLEVLGNGYTKVNNHYIFHLFTGAGTPCEVSTFVVFDSSGSATDYKSFYYCDCNEPNCKGELASIYNDSMIKLETHFWSGEPEEDTPMDSFAENTVQYSYYTINANGKITNQKTQQKSVAYYICYNSDHDSELKLWIGFDDNNKASSAKYLGMNSTLELVFIKEENENMEDSYPVLTSYYNEIDGGKINGVYKLTHSGNWDYVEYTRDKDLQKFNFTIDQNSNNYSETPCF